MSSDTQDLKWHGRIANQPQRGFFDVTNALVGKFLSLFRRRIEIHNLVFPFRRKSGFFAPVFITL
jgi:hypothetical protein